MNEAEWPDRGAHDVAVASIRRHSMKMDEWEWTAIAELRPQLAHRVLLHAQELPLASAFINDKSWYAFTTRRIVACHGGVIGEIDPRYGIESKFSMFFKGMPGDLDRTDNRLPIETAHVRSLRTGESIAFEYETGYASMAPIYAIRFWNGNSRFRLPISE